MFSCPSLGHFSVIDAVLLRPEFWGGLVCQVDEAADVCELAAIPVKFISLFHKMCGFFVSPLGVVE